jgi:hypothetical protein
VKKVRKVEPLDSWMDSLRENYVLGTELGLPDGLMEGELLGTELGMDRWTCCG